MRHTLRIVVMQEVLWYFCCVLFDLDQSSVATEVELCVSCQKVNDRTGLEAYCNTEVAFRVEVTRKLPRQAFKR